MSEITNGKKIVSGMVWRFGEKITAQAVSLIVTIILARILMPEDYGIVAIVNVFIAIAEIFVTSGLGTALIQKNNTTTTDFSTLFWVNVAMSLVLYGLVFLISPFIAGFYEMPLLTPVLRVFAIRLPINAINSIQNAYVSRQMDFKKFFFATIIGTIISAFVGIGMAYAGYGVWALVGQMLTNTVIDTIVLFITIKWKPTFDFSLEAAKPLVSYGWKILATDLIGTIFNQVNAFIIGRKYTSSDLAYYTQGRKYPELVNNNISATLSAVLFPAMSLSDNKEEIKAIRKKALKMLEYVLFPLMFGMFTVADKMILVLLTEKWILVVPYVRITCIASVLGVFGTTLIQEIKAIGRSDITLQMELIKKPIFLAIAIFSIRYGVIAVAITMVINEIIAFFFNVYPVRKYIGFDFGEHLKDALPSFLMSLCMCAGVYYIGLIIHVDVICLIVQVVVGGAIYVGLSIATKNESFYYLKNMIVGKVKR